MSWWKKLFGGASKSTLIQAAKDRNHALAKDLIAAGGDIDAAAYRTSGRRRCERQPE